MFNWNKFPWTDYRGINLDWIIQRIKDLSSRWDTLPDAIREEAEKIVPGLVAEELTTGGAIQHPVLIGDSFLSGFNALDDAQNHVDNNWGVGFAKCSGQSYNDIVIVGSRGAGFCNRGSAGTYRNATFAELVTQYSARLAADTYGSTDSVDAVVACGGYNDSGYSLSEIQQGIAAFVSAAQTTFPNAKIYILCNPCYRYPGDVVIEAMSTYVVSSKMPVYINPNSWKWTFCSNSYMWASDQIHPSGIAHDGVKPTDVIGRMIWEWCNGYGMTGGKWDYELEHNNSSNDITNAAKISVADGRAYIYINVVINKDSTGSRLVCNLPRPLWTSYTPEHPIGVIVGSNSVIYKMIIRGRNLQVGGITSHAEDITLEGTILLDPAAMDFIKST